MNTRNSSALVVCAMLALALAACQKTSNTDRPKPVSESSGSSSQSVAAPSNTLPPSDAAIKPTNSTSSSGNAATPTQGNPTELSKAEEKSTMPHSGQVNNHSTPDGAGTRGTQ